MSVPGRYVPEQGVKCPGYLVKVIKESPSICGVEGTGCICVGGRGVDVRCCSVSKGLERSGKEQRRVLLMYNAAMVFALKG